MEVQNLLQKRKQFHERAVCPLTPVVWVLVAFNSRFPFLSIELGIILAVFYALFTGYLCYWDACRMWGSTKMGLWEVATTFCVAWSSIWFVDGFDKMPAEGFYILFGMSLVMHICLMLLYRRHVFKMVRKCYTNVDTASQQDEDIPPSV